MESSSSRIRMDDGDDNEDRLSSLPDPLIHEIFKFMDTKQVISTSLLSKRWSSLCLSNPYLNFILDETWDLKDSRVRSEGSKRFENFVDQVLLSRDHDLQAFRVEKYSNGWLEKLDEWVGHAIARNVQHIQLEDLNIQRSILETLCENVKCLTLDKVFIMGEEKCEELLLDCPVMETLVLHDCFFGSGDYIYRNIKLSAPILKVLKFEGATSTNYIIDNLSSVVTAVVNVCISYNVSPKKNNERRDLLDNILRGLTNATSLLFCLSNLLACSKVPISLSTVTSFQRLRYLKLKKSSHSMDGNDLCFSTTLKLLEKCPNVETLVLDGYLKLKTEIMEEDLIAQLQSWCRRCHLKTLKIETKEIAITDCAFKFIKCIMRNAASLKNVVMTTPDMPMEQEKLVDICLRLKAKPKVMKISSQRIQVSLKPFSKIQWKSV